MSRTVALETQVTELRHLVTEKKELERREIERQEQQRQARESAEAQLRMKFLEASITSAEQSRAAIEELREELNQLHRSLRESAGAQEALARSTRRSANALAAAILVTALILGVVSSRWRPEPAWGRVTRIAADVRTSIASAPFVQSAAQAIRNRLGP